VSPSALITAKLQADFLLLETPYNALIFAWDFPLRFQSALFIVARFLSAP
tara:strand:- start:11010 stop:11159 length:150 start_codon:yes stop_codon:yes gene_type:complete